MLRKVVLRISSDPAETNITRQRPRKCLKHGVLMPTVGNVSGLLYRTWGKCWKIVLFLLLNQICGSGGVRLRLAWLCVGFNCKNDSCIKQIIQMFCCNLFKINCASENIKYESWMFCFNSKIINSSGIVWKVWNFISDIIYTLKLILKWKIPSFSAHFSPLCHLFILALLRETWVTNENKNIFNPIFY